MGKITVRKQRGDRESNERVQVMCVKDCQNTSRGANCLDRESRKKTMMSKGRVPLPRTNRRMETDIGEREAFLMP